MKQAMLRAVPLLALWVLTDAVIAQNSPAQTPPPSTRPAAWSEIDQRMVFLTVQLASVETSIDAAEKQLKAAGYRITVRSNDAARYEKGNEMMDRNAGGPRRWDQFYGKTAEKFFYNPQDPNTLRLTASILETNDPNARWPKPADQRPPQFDYIYRANSNAKAQAEADVAKLAGKVNELLARRRQLEAEQAGLWCKIAFRAAAGRELLGKPMYRFDLKSNNAEGAAAAQQLAALRAAMDFLRVNNKLIELAEKNVDADQGSFVAGLEETVTRSRNEFESRLMQQPTLVNASFDTSTTIGKLNAVAKRMHDTAKNIADAHRLSLDGDKAGDEQRKQTFRSQLQDSLMIYAEAVLAGDECVNLLAKEWNISPDFEKTAVVPEVKLSTPHLPATGGEATAAPVAPVQTEDARSAKAEIIAVRWGREGHWADVTARFNTLLEIGKEFDVSSKVFGVDPRPGSAKRLEISYRAFGKERTHSIGGGQLIVPANFQRDLDKQAAIDEAIADQSKQETADEAPAAAAPAPQVPQTPVAPQAPAAPQPPSTPASDGSVTYNWNNGVRVTFSPDGTVTTSNKMRGKWSLADQRLVIDWNHRGEEAFDLSADGRTLTSLKLRNAVHLREGDQPLMPRAAGEPADASEVLPTMTGSVDRKQKGAIVLSNDEKIFTAKAYAPPVAFRITAQTDSTDVRIGYAADQIIFNWEVDPNHFRIDGGPASGRHQHGIGKIPTNQWVQVDLVVMPDEMIVSVDGQERFRTKANFSKINQPLSIFTHRATVMVKSVKVSQN